MFFCGIEITQNYVTGNGITQSTHFGDIRLTKCPLDTSVPLFNLKFELKYMKPDMKYITLLLLIFTTVCYSQTLKGIVTLNPLKGIGDETQLSEKAKEPIYLSYLYSKKISIQELVTKGSITIDTVLIDDGALNDLPYTATETTVKPNIAIHYKDFNANIYRFESESINQNLAKKVISIKDSIPEYKWKLFDESQTITGYLCKKATTTKQTGRSQAITAWYCEDIPIDDGPFDFTGLPGLILQIEIDDRSIIKFEEINFLNEVNINIEEPENAAEMLTMDEYLKKKANGK